jgi:hypothetical protein
LPHFGLFFSVSCKTKGQRQHGKWARLDSALPRAACLLVGKSFDLTEPQLWESAEMTPVCESDSVCAHPFN